ncbi:MAG TPA: hypothetical protein VK670_17445 [Silvibacterium sp.]|nr:hypothetical protein [Silvibacterium sp.]
MMNNFQLLFAAVFPTTVVLVGILLNRQDIHGLRQEIGSLRSDLSGRIELLTRKVIGLTDRVSHLEARMGK